MAVPVRYYSNVSKIMTVQTPMDLDDTVCSVNDASGLPGSFPYNIAVDYEASTLEIMLVTGVVGNNLTVVRGQQDTAASNHSVGAIVVHVWTAADATYAMAHYDDPDGVHGVTGSVVGTTDVQTLTNKTMSGASNTFSNIPSTAVTGTFANVVVDQTNAALPGIKVNRNAAAAVDVAQLGTSVLVDSAGQLRTRADTNTFSQRWYGTLFTTVLAEMSAAGRLSCVGLTTTGSITATGQALAIGAVNASGLITASGGLTVPAGQALSVISTGTFGCNGPATFNARVDLNQPTFLWDQVVFGGASIVTFNNGFTVISGKQAYFNSGGILDCSPGSVIRLNGDISRDARPGLLLMDTQVGVLATATNTAGVANSIQDIAGCTYQFTVPAGRTATVKVSSTFQILGAAATTATFELLLNVDAALFTATGPNMTTTAAVQYVMSKAWIVTGLAAGVHTIKLQYRNINGVTTPSLQGGAGRTSIEYEIFW